MLVIMSRDVGWTLRKASIRQAHGRPGLCVVPQLNAQQGLVVPEHVQVVIFTDAILDVQWHEGPPGPLIL